MTDLVPADGRVDDVGDKIGDLRAHLRQAHPLKDAWIADLDPAELAALHRRLHGRAVDPEPDLVDVHFVEMRTDPAERATTTLPLAAATDHAAPLVWLPMRIADLVHDPDAPGHDGKAGCRACADVIDATIRGLVELDSTPQAEITALTKELFRLTATAASGRDRLAAAFPPDDDASGDGAGTELGPDGGSARDPGAEDAVIAELADRLERLGDEHAQRAAVVHDVVRDLRAVLADDDAG